MYWLETGNNRAPEDERYYGESPHRVGSNTAVIVGILVWTAFGLLYHYVAISQVRPGRQHSEFAPEEVK